MTPINNETLESAKKGGENLIQNGKGFGTPLTTNKTPNFQKRCATTNVREADKNSPNPQVSSNNNPPVNKGGQVFSMSNLLGVLVRKRIAKSKIVDLCLLLRQIQLLAGKLLLI